MSFRELRRRIGRLAIVGANYRLAEGTAVPDVLVGELDDDDA